MATDQRSKIDRLSWFCTKHRLGVILVTAVVTILFGIGIFRIQGEVHLWELMAYDHPFIKIMTEFDEVFGTGGSFVGITVTAKDDDIFKPSVLKKIQQIDKEVAEWEETMRVMTFSIGSRSAQVAKAMGDGIIKFRPLMWPDVPETDKGLAKLKKEIFSDPGMRAIVSSNGQSTLVGAMFKPKVTFSQTFELMQGLIQKYSDDEIKLEMVGYPIMMGWIYSCKTQIIMVMAASVAFMIFILFLIFRNFIGMAAPVAFGLVSTGMGLGFIGWSGLNFSPLLYVLAFLVAARKVSHAVQITSRYMEEYNETRDNVQSCYNTMRSMLMPNWAGVVTDAAGFSILYTVNIFLMQEVAIFMTFWMLVVCQCGIFTPAICSFMPMKDVSKDWVIRKKKQGLMDKICTGATQFSIGPGKFLIAGIVVVVAVFCIYQARNLKIGDPEPGTPLLWPDHPYNQATANMNKSFRSTSETLTLYFKGIEKESVYNPKVMTTFDAFDRHMRESLPDIYKSSEGFTGIMKQLNIILRDGDVLWNELPYEPEVMDGLIGYARAALSVPMQRLYFDVDMKMSHIDLSFTDHTSDNLLRIREAAYGFFDEYPQKIDAGEFFLIGGTIGMEIATNEEMKRTHARIEIMVLSAIFLICSMFYRSFVAGLMFTLPLMLANSIAFAYMAMNNIGLSINTLPVAAVGVGVGVDFAIYIYNRTIEEYPRHDGMVSAVIRSVQTSGKAVVFTGLTMVLPIMTWFFISDLKFQAQMGIFLAMILTTNVVLSITLHPLMLTVFKPKFITKSATTKV
jgi:predicted RND superfamily exporter protein